MPDKQTTPTSSPDAREGRIRSLMYDQLHASKVDVKNVSSRHRHHTHQLRGPEHTGETHYNLRVVSPLFEDMSSLQRSRKVHEILKPEFETGLHALSLSLLAPSQEQSA